MQWGNAIRTTDTESDLRKYAYVSKSGLWIVSGGPNIGTGTDSGTPVYLTISLKEGFMILTYFNQVKKKSSFAELLLN